MTELADEARAHLARDAQEVVRLWYEWRLRHGRALEPVKAPRRNVPQDVPDDDIRSPDLLATAKKERPQHFTTSVTRPVLDEHGQQKRDRKGRPMFETVDILDSLTAHGTETRRSSRAKVPRGQSMAYQPTARTEPSGSGLLSWISTVMRRLYIAEPAAVEALEMWAAGYSQRKMASVLGMSKTMVTELLDASWLVIRFALLHRPKPELSRGPYRRFALTGDLYAETNVCSLDQAD